MPDTRPDAKPRTTLGHWGRAAADTRSDDGPLDPPLNTVLGHYRLTGVLGRGGMGVVYRGQDTVLGRPVAVKILPPQFAAMAEARERFLREAVAAARFTHPNLVHVYDAGVQGRYCYLAMELVDGTDTETLLRSSGPFPWPFATRIVADAARALAAVHASGLVHRDIKPGNILLAHDGISKVTDFGVVKIDDLAGGALTGDNRLLGTPEFLAPEQATGRAVDARTDLYSLGATYFALLTGHAPFESGDPAEILRGHVRHRPPDPRQYADDIPASCRAVLDGCLAKWPDDRYQSAEELLADLDAVAAGRAVRRRSRPVTGPVLVAVTVAIGFACLALAVWLSWPGLQPPTPPAVAVGQPDILDATEVNARTGEVAAGLAGRVVLLRLRVNDTWRDSAGVIMLNALKDWRSPRNIAVLVDVDAQASFRSAGIDSVIEWSRNREIVARGVAGNYVYQRKPYPVVRVRSAEDVAHTGPRRVITPAEVANHVGKFCTVRFPAEPTQYNDLIFLNDGSVRFGAAVQKSAQAEFARSPGWTGFPDYDRFFRGRTVTVHGTVNRTANDWLSVRVHHPVQLRWDAP